MRKNNLLLILLLGLFQTAIAQHTLCGRVDIDNVISIDAEVLIIETDEIVQTQPSGEFCFADLAPGVYSIYASYANFVSPIARVLVDGNQSNLVIEIETSQLDTVSVVGHTRAGIKEMHSIKTSVVDLSKEAQAAVSVEQLMNRSAGVRVRNTGGLGSDADIVVGGFNGKSIKFLMDGIPIDYLGSSMSLTKMPANAAEYIEVYKGVMPTEVGIDALGAAINIVTKKPNRTATNLSYEVGSFNTHRLSTHNHIKKSDKFSWGINAFLNYSANNFKVKDLPVADEETGRTKYISAKLFHNKYKQYSAEAYVNFENRKWADIFRIKINSYGLVKDLQNDFISRSRPFGSARNREYAYAVPSIEYKKNFLDNRLQISQFAVFSHIKFELIDTLKNARYDWYGNKYEAVSGSEMGIDYSNLKEPIIRTTLNNFTYRGLFSYHVRENHKLILNVVNNYFAREADDLNLYLSKYNISYNRLIAGLGYQYYFLDNRMEGLSQIKFLNSYTVGTSTDPITGRKEVPVSNSGWSLAQSLKYHSYKGWLMRVSVENTYRLPDQTEIFGDNVFIVPNVLLKPEKSLNLNFGLRYKPNEKYHVELSTYMRNVKDLIRLKEISQFQSKFLNLDKVKGYGVELELLMRPVKGLALSGNLTYNEFRFKGSNDELVQNDHFINARVSNMPFYFGNAMASYTFDKVFNKKDALQLYWSYTYVHQYYLDFIEKQFEPDGFLGLFGQSKVSTNRVIPIQHVHAAGLVWSMDIKKDKKVALSAEMDNIFNHAVYNTFKMQSAGRSFSFKFTYDFK